MKCCEFKIFVEQLSGAVKDLGGSAPAGLLQALYPVLDAQPQKTVASIVTKLSSNSSLLQSGEPVSAVRQFDGLLAWYEAFGKPAAAKDLIALFKLLRTMRVVDVGSFARQASEVLAPPAANQAPEARPDVIDYYCRVLEAALGKDDQFAAAAAEVSSEANVRTHELLLIAKRFAHGASRTRPAALKKIWSRQQAIVASQAKVAATDGRIAG